MFAPFNALPDYRLDIIDRQTERIVSTGYFTAKQEEQMGEMIRGINPEVLSFRLYAILHEFDDKTEFGKWLAENTSLPLDPGI